MGIGMRISDGGGGFPREEKERIWDYLYSTAEPVITDGVLYKKGKTRAANARQELLSAGGPLAGFGVGLPVSRLYAAYLGGELDVVSLPGLGTDAFLFLWPIVVPGH